MTKPSRFFLGQGENLVSEVKLTSGFGTKDAPYEFEEACHRLSAMATKTVQVLEELPKLARPADQVVASLTVHPSGLAKSYHPR